MPASANPDTTDVIAKRDDGFYAGRQQQVHLRPSR